jgi:hypothetical protein
MYRNSLGFADKRIKPQQWEMLAMEVKSMIKKHILKYGRLTNPGIISGFIGIK